MTIEVFHGSWIIRGATTDATHFGAGTISPRALSKGLTVGRDHSIECEVCGVLTGGINDFHCLCDDEFAAWVGMPAFDDYINTLSHNLVYAAMLTRAYARGRADEQLDMVMNVTRARVVDPEDSLQCACAECRMLR